MNRTVRFLLPLLLLFIGTVRLPAPISEGPETTPTPNPKREITARSKPKPEATVKPKATSSHSFAGTWTGSTVNTSSSGNRDVGFYVIKIADDEKTVLINWSLPGGTISGPDYQASCQRFGSALTWNLKQIGENPGWVSTDTLRINSDRTTTFVREGRFIAGDFQNSTFNNTGTLSQQGVSLAPSVQQTATTPATTPTTTAAPKGGGLPVAKPVPNKRGFVYNPFDPNSRTLLDIRGKGSGTKVRDPFSGKLFIVP